MYRIRIEKIEEIEHEKKGDWVVIEKRPYTQEEVDAANSTWREDEIEPKSLKEVRGYTPSYITAKVTEHEVYRQLVNDLDLAAVILAVNIASLEKAATDT